jgi:LysR family transcriptional regulator, low CO2-responsive transcriptional regulator
LTLSQLRSFLTVARLGSVKAAARSLEVSDAAVSGAVRSLRDELEDELYVRSGGALELTPGGRRLASGASEILGLADQTKRVVREAEADTRTLRVAVTPAVAEFAAEPLLEAFRRRNAKIDVALRIARSNEFVSLLADRTVDIALGPRVGGAVEPVIDSEPFLRYTLVVVAARGHALAGSRAVAPGSLVGTPWLLGPFEADASTETGGFLARQAIVPQRVHTFPNFAAALAQVVAGRGITLAIRHTVSDELERGALVELDVRGTPLQGLWHASMLPRPRRIAGAETLHAFLMQPETTRALLDRGGGVPAERLRARAPVNAERGG